MNSNIKIQILKFNCNYSTTCHIKFGIQIKENNKEEYIESKHSFKIEKNQQINLINDNLYLNINHNDIINNESELEILLLVYTKAGYQTAGIGNILIKDIKNDENIQIEIKKCVLGNGNLELKFELPNLIFTNDEINLGNNENSINLNKELDNDDIQKLKNENYNLILENKKLKEQYNLLNNQFKKVENNQNNIQNENINDKNKIIEQLKEKIKYFEEEENELKGIIDDLKKENKEMIEEKNQIIYSHFLHYIH